MFSVAATTIGVRPTVNVRNAGKVRCRAAASAAVAPASIGSMTGFRRAGVVDGLGVYRSGASFHSTVARQTLAGGRVATPPTPIPRTRAKRARSLKSTPCRLSHTTSAAI